jgi:hypothetical protein
MLSKKQLFVKNVYAVDKNIVYRDWDKWEIRNGNDNLIILDIS